MNNKQKRATIQEILNNVGENEYKIQLQSLLVRLLYELDVYADKFFDFDDLKNDIFIKIAELKQGNDRLDKLKDAIKTMKEYED